MTALTWSPKSRTPHGAGNVFRQAPVLPHPSPSALPSVEDNSLSKSLPSPSVPVTWETCPADVASDAAEEHPNPTHQWQASSDPPIVVVPNPSITLAACCSCLNLSPTRTVSHGQKAAACQSKAYPWHTHTQFLWQLYFKGTKILQPPNAMFLSLLSVIPISHMRKVTRCD